MPNVLAVAESTGLAKGLEGVLPFITKAFDFMTQEPMVYFVALGVLGVAIGIFSRAKNAAM